MINYLSQKRKKRFSLWYLVIAIIFILFTYHHYQSLQKDIYKTQADAIVSDYIVYTKSLIDRDILVNNLNYVDNEEFIDEYSSSTPLYVDHLNKKNRQYNTIFKFYGINEQIPKNLKITIDRLRNKTYNYQFINQNTIELVGVIPNKGYIHITKHIEDTQVMVDNIDDFFLIILVASIFNYFLFLYLLSLFNENDKQKLELYEEQRNLNRVLERKIEEKTIAFKEQQKMLQQQEINILIQSKNAQMGEMIGNIAHQWRQPLSLISTLTSAMLLKKEMNSMDDNYFNESAKTIMTTTQYLSKTIDTFRNFISEEKVQKTINIQEHLSEIFKIIDATLKNNYISLIDEIDSNDPIIIDTIASELSEVVINIINNAKDALVENNIQDPWIKFNIEKNLDSIFIKIEDNAGGVPENILPKIFDPYFTTKHQSQGTGLGLYMSKKIITESLNGDIFIKNSKNGAIFHIELPLS